MNPLISVIIPVYNVEKYLRKCLDSICGQTYRNLEILCVNDGSTDGSAAILEEYAAKDARIKVFTQANAGQGAARNVALKHASGEWITGVDADDYLESDAIEYACSGISDTVDIINFGIKVVWGNCVANPHMDAHYARKDYEGLHPITARFLLDKPCEFCAKLWRGSFLKSQHAQFPEGIIFEDWVFYWMYAPLGRNICYLTGPKYCYIRHQGSTMSTAQCKSPRALQHIDALEAVLAFRKEHPLSPNDSLVDWENFYLAYRFVRDSAPNDKQAFAEQEFRRLAESYGLKARFPSRLRFLYPLKWWQKPFVSHRPGKSSYGLGPLKLVIVHYRNGVVTTRVLGMKLKQKKL